MKRRGDTKRERALLALLTHGSVREAGRAAGISEATLYRYLAEDDFSEELARERRGVMEAGLARLQQAQTQAVETLIRNLHCESPAVEVRTAQIILEHTQKAYETGEVVRRLEELEKTLKD
jgi:molybdenum-dependent DNA-binding transcriptional regulator ModE